MNPTENNTKSYKINLGL